MSLNPWLDILVSCCFSASHCVVLLHCWDLVQGDVQLLSHPGHGGVDSLKKKAAGLLQTCKNL